MPDPHIISSCTFQEEVAELLHRHAKHRHRTPMTRLQGVLHTHLGASYIVSTNPIYAHPDVQTFSDYARDALFGSHTQPFTRKWTGCLAVFPQPTPLHIDRAINHAITATTRKHPTAVILVTPQFTSTTQITTLYKHHHCHRLATPLDKGPRVPNVILICNDAYLRQHQPLRADVEYVAHACASTWNCAYRAHVPTRRRPWHGLFPHRTGTRPMPLVGMGPAAPPPNTEPHVSVDLAYVLQKLQCPANDEIVGRQHMQVPCVNQNTCITPPIHALKDLKKALGDSAVGYLDKNNGLLFVACPVWYWHRNKTMFLDDTRHYHAIPELAPTIMEGFRAFHTKLGLARFHKKVRQHKKRAIQLHPRESEGHQPLPPNRFILQPPTQENLQLRLPRPIFHPQTL